LAIVYRHRVRRVFWLRADFQHRAGACQVLPADMAGRARRSSGDRVGSRDRVGPTRRQTDQRTFWRRHEVLTPCGAACGNGSSGS
jgi:hypothetical protein